MPELSVVIVSYRCRDLLAACLASLAVQRDDVDMEVFVLDNHSCDGTLEATAEYSWVDSRDIGENIGFARANNLGFARCTGRAVLALNPDTVVPPGALRACLDRLWSSDDIGVLSPKLVDSEGRLDRRCKRGFPTIWSSFCYFTGLDRHLHDRFSTRYTAGWLSEDEAGDVESVTGAFMLMPRDVLWQVGGFDEQFFMYAEDIDLCLRFIAVGKRVHYWPGVSVVHVGAGSNVKGHRPPAADAAYFRTMAPFIRKHRPGIRGRITANLISVAAEVMYIASRMSARRELR
ncbi:MAG TPA: glycosyltransferase family 2 protein [Rhodocyclaceae bacterium]|nr:glycosyltransferase family 2 protein [Rhodocyclaceae bacterium]